MSKPSYLHITVGIIWLIHLVIALWYFQELFLEQDSWPLNFWCAVIIVGGVVYILKKCR